MSGFLHGVKADEVARKKENMRVVISVGKDEIGASALRLYFSAWIMPRMDSGSSNVLISASMACCWYSQEFASLESITASVAVLTKTQSRIQKKNPQSLKRPHRYIPPRVPTQRLIPSANFCQPVSNHKRYCRHSSIRLLHPPRRHIPGGN